MIRSLSHPLHLVIGLAIWAAWFVLMYGGLSAVCSVEPPERGLRSTTWLNYAMVGLTALTVLLVFNLTCRCWRARKSGQPCSQQDRFCIHVAAGLYVAAMIAMISIGIPAAILPPCL